MPKHIDTLGKIEDFKAPWESDTGETEIDKPTLKKLIFNLRADKAKALDAKDEVTGKLSEVEKDRDTLKSEVDSKDPDSAGKIAKLEAKLKDSEAKTAAADLRADRVEIAAEKGLTPKQAKRLQGATREELEADADELLEDLGLSKTEETDEEREAREEAEESGRVAPKARVRLVQSGDQSGAGSQEPDYDAIAASIQGHRAL